jgi:hypothetical protein
VVSNWLKSNILTLNSSKTKYLAFSASRRGLPTVGSIYAHNCSRPYYHCNENCLALERVDNIRYLGVIIDSNLNFKPHLSALVSRLRKLIYIFKQLRNSADHKTSKSIYFALCQSLLTYCIPAWGGMGKNTLLEVERAQRGILKTAASLPYRHPTLDLYKIWDVLTVRQLFITRTLLRKHNELPYDPKIYADKRRKHKIFPSLKLSTSLARRHFYYQGNFL